MTRGAAGCLAWSIWVITLIGLGITLALLRSAANPLDFVGQIFFGIAFLLFPAVGALIASRRPDNAIGWIFCAVAAVYLGPFAQAYAHYTLVTMPGSLPGGQWLAWLSTWIGNPGFYFIFTFVLLLFPDGKLLSPAWRPVAWLAAGWIIVSTVGMALSPGPLDVPFSNITNPVGIPALSGLAPPLLALEGPILLSLAAAALISVVLRYRRAGAEVQQQLKWFAYSVSLLLSVATCLAGVDYLAPMSPLRRLVGDGVFAVAVAGLPVSIGFAILKYRLFDIDLLIRRTLVYSALSAALALVYFGSVVLLESALRLVTGEGQNQIITVLSTLALAALAAPLRGRIQRFIDRRFYRKKYDAARTLAEFAAVARDETDLSALTARLAGVVEETMQPESVKVWLGPGAAKPLGGALAAPKEQP